MRQFAEQEITLPTGPHQNERLRISRNPWLGLWLDAIDSNLWRRFNLTGVGQGGKTLGGSGIPVLYHLFECRETVIYGAPTLDMAADKWRQDILPLIEASSYRDLLPESGRGSRGGTALFIEFRHGPTLRFMTGGGDDKVRAGFTSRVAVITETDGMDEAGGSSRETDKINQIESRTNAFGDRARLYMECTLSTESGRTWRELKDGTDSRIILPCPHCGAWVSPEREHLSGWQDARNVMEARELAMLACPKCGTGWSEADRAAANGAAKLLHRGQNALADGTIVGMLPETMTLSVRFCATNNLLVPMKRVAEEEWSAPRRTDPELAEKKLRQFYWAQPSEDEAITLSEIDVARVLARTIDLERGRVPADCLALTLGIDLGKWMHHWVAVAWRPGGTPHVADYGVMDVPSANMGEELAILAALRKFRDEICAVGWPVAGTAAGQTAGMMRPGLALVDSGHWENSVVTFCRESGGMFLPSKGFGADQVGRKRSRLSGEPGYEPVLQPGGYSLIETNADHWKSFVHARLQTPVGQPGGLTLFHVAAANEHLSFAKHLTNEVKSETFVAGRGMVTKWTNKARKKNHYLDAAALACVAGDGVGQRVASNEPPPAAPAQAPTRAPAPAQNAAGPSGRDDGPTRSPLDYRGKW